MKDHKSAPAQEALRYAALLDLGTKAGLVLLAAAFVAYALGWPEPQVPLQRLPDLWGLPVAEYLKQTGLPTGWGWTALLPRADLLGLLGIVLLSGVSLVCLAALLPLYAARGDRAYVVLVLLEIVVIVFAASGLLAGGH
jgi:hypothetical protein